MYRLQWQPGPLYGYGVYCADAQLMIQAVSSELLHGPWAVEILLWIQHGYPDSFGRPKWGKQHFW